MAKVSVIVPVFGVEKYIERCAVSLFEQSFDDIQYVFVDDCTPDNSFSILKGVLSRYEGRQQQCVFVKQPRNLGLAKARRKGLEFATGEYVIHIDSDDWVDHEIIACLYNAAQKENADIVSCDYYVSDGKNQKEKTWICSKSKDEILGQILDHSLAPCIWNKLVKRSVYNNKNIIYPQYDMGEDIALVTQLVFFSTKIIHVNSPLYYYYYNPLSMSRVRSVESCKKKWLQIKSNAQIVLDLLKENNMSSKYRAEILIFKEHCRDNNLLPAVQDRWCKKEWLRAYPEAHRMRFFSKYASWKMMVRYFCVCFNIYNYMLKMRE